MTGPAITSPHTSRLRLVTIDRFPPSMPDVSCLSPMPDVGCTTFHNHYIQHADWVHDGSDSRTDYRKTTLSTLANQLGGFLQAIWVAGDRTASGCPEWFRLGSDTPAQVAAEFPADESAMRNDERLSWLHVDLQENQDAAAIEDTIRGICLLSARDTIPTFLTAVAGNDTAADGFTTLLPEDRIRIPLYLFLHGSDMCHIQTLTGSDDLLFTVAQMTGIDLPVSDDKAEDDATAAALNLLSVATSPGENRERSLLIHHSDVVALRTDHFLYAEHNAIEDTQLSPARALYVKPEDVWNVHNVADEYQSVADQMSARVRQLQHVDVTARPST